MQSTSSRRTVGPWCVPGASTPVVQGWWWRRPVLRRLRPCRSLDRQPSPPLLTCRRCQHSAAVVRLAVWTLQSVGHWRLPWQPPHRCVSPPTTFCRWSTSGPATTPSEQTSSTETLWRVRCRYPTTCDQLNGLVMACVLLVANTRWSDKTPCGWHKILTYQ